MREAGDGSESEIGPQISVKELVAGDGGDDALDFEPVLHAGGASATRAWVGDAKTPAETEEAIDFEPDGSRLAAYHRAPAQPTYRAPIPEPPARPIAPPAVAPRADASPPRAVRFPMPSLVLSPAALAQIREPAADRELARTDEPESSRARVTAQTVAAPEPIPPSLVFLADPYSPRADAYRSLRRKLASSGNPRVVGVTSAHAAEGKTTLACNLALALRESARGNVLLVEANHRAPAIARLLGFAPGPCFLHQLARHVADPGATWIAAEPLPRLHVMAIDPAAQHDPLLDPVAFAAGMARLKEEAYDHIVVDAPPVLGSADGNVIADAVEGMIFAALALRSMRKEMRKAVEQLSPAPVLGVVVLEA